MLEAEEDEDELLNGMDNDSLDLEECYVVVKDYSKGAIDELDLFEGQVVCVIDDSDKGIVIFITSKTPTTVVAALTSLLTSSSPPPFLPLIFRPVVREC